MTTPLVLNPANVVTGFPLAPIIFPFLWLFVDTSFIIPQVRVGIPIAFPFLYNTRIKP